VEGASLWGPSFAGHKRPDTARFSNLGLVILEGLGGRKRLQVLTADYDSGGSVAVHCLKFELSEVDFPIFQSWMGGCFLG
jgi:hypothetical protein